MAKTTPNFLDLDDKDIDAFFDAMEDAESRRPLKTGRHWRNGEVSCSYGELVKLREYVQSKCDLTGMSRLNPSLTRMQAYNIFFGEWIDKKPADELVESLSFKNLIREFVLNRKKWSDDWVDMPLILNK
jgi:hypothetical protein